ncbi:hypothetical protein E4U42_004742 [Claviceps africana]|uniref:CoA transferase n=1 Tax=Claviceps africana TaxID=83212 RepID=A0A8K0NGT2_9HYPO|nr:hypothetical protein E4U42_004742 [Claviceps africana]
MNPRPRGANLLDGGCPFYDTYETRDGRFLAVGALEPRFFRRLLVGMGLEHRAPALEADRFDVDAWPALRALFRDTFRRRTRREWEAIFDGSDACTVPVLDYDELEVDPAREGDQRPCVALSDTPCLAIKQRPAPADDGDSAPEPDPVHHGQGPGVPGDGYDAHPLAPGEGGPDVLRAWLGWEMGREYHVHEGGYVLAAEPATSKL